MKTNRQIIAVVIAASVSFSSPFISNAEDATASRSQATGQQPSGQNQTPAYSTPGGTQGQAQSQLNTQDSGFLHKAASAGMMEVQMGKLASEKAQNQQIKQFGQRLVADHTKANEELKQIAQSKGVQLPQTMDQQHAKMMEHLSGLSGEQFDKAFVDHAVKDHQKTIDQFQRQANQGQDQQIKAFAAKTLPTLKEHMATAKTLSVATSAGGQIQEPAGADQQQSDPSQQQEQQETPPTPPTPPSPDASSVQPQP